MSRTPRRGRSYEYCVRVSIANTDRQILERIQSEFGGTLASMGWRKPTWKTGYALIWTNAAAARLLAAVAPRLRLKEEQASALLRFSNHIRRCRRERDRAGRLLPFSERELKIREEYYGYLRSLNARGRRFAGSPRPAPKYVASRWKGESIPERYLAGFIDAEGSLMIARSRSRRYGTICYRARITVSNTNRNILKEIQDEYGGILAEDPKAQVGWKNTFQLIWTNGMVGDLLRRVTPFLRVKGRQAEILLDFIDHMRETPQSRTGDGRSFAPHPPEVMEFRETLYRCMRTLNAKGRIPRAGST